MWLPLLGLIIGIAVGLAFPLSLAPSYARYMSVAVLAAMDSVFGGFRAGLEGHFNTKIFVTGFFGNIILAAVLTYIGDRLGVELYLAALFAFGVRLFQNSALIRRILLGQHQPGGERQ
ncbi:MAG: small basic family protein [bacterium]|jgi:small basic protein